MNFVEMTGMLGSVGAVIAGIAYLPQIMHLVKERCTAGLSRQAFALWLISSILVATHSFAMRDIAFILLSTVQIAAITVILWYCARYRGQVCPTHQAKPAAEVTV